MFGIIMLIVAIVILYLYLKKCAELKAVKSENHVDQSRQLKDIESLVHAYEAENGLRLQLEDQLDQQKKNNLELVNLVAEMAIPNVVPKIAEIPRPQIVIPEKKQNQNTPAWQMDPNVMYFFQSSAYANFTLMSGDNDWAERLPLAPAEYFKQWINDGYFRYATRDESIEKLFRVEDLRTIMRDRGLKISGRKQELLDRLKEYAPEVIENELANKIYLSATDTGRELSDSLREEYYDERAEEYRKQTAEYWRQNVNEWRDLPSVTGVRFILRSSGYDCCSQCQELPGDYQLTALPAIPPPECDCAHTEYSWGAIFDHEIQPAWKAPPF